MSGPVAVDTTVKAMVELVTRASKDADFRRLCETDMEAAVADLKTAPEDGARFEYSWDAGSYALRIHRGGETTTISRSADGQLTVDNDALGFSRPDDDELSDVELMAVAGGGIEDCGCGQFEGNQRQMCKSACACYARFSGLTSWIGIEPCWAGADFCLGTRTNGSASYLWPCEEQGGSAF